jgi:hypothetical protein
MATSEKSKKNSHIVFIICILIASFFWLTIKLSDDYSEAFLFKVNYRNVPSEKMLTDVIDTNVNITIKAKGFQMLKLILTEDLENLNINLNKYDILHLKGNIYYVNTVEIKAKIGTLIGVPSKQIDIPTQRLEFKLEDLFEKKVTVINKLRFNFLPQYNLYSNISISPNSLSIFGPKSTIDTIESIFTENKEINEISADINESAILINPDHEHLHLSIEKVSIKANVEKFTESNIETTIDLSSINLKVKVFPNSVKVFFTVAQKDFSNVKQSDFKVKPNLRNIDISTAGKLQLEVVEKPDFISSIRIQPSEVEFLIIK